MILDSMTITTYIHLPSFSFFFFFFFNDTATTEIYTLSLHDALPISERLLVARPHLPADLQRLLQALKPLDRKSTRLNSSHSSISYAVFCLKKKKKKKNKTTTLTQQDKSIKNIRILLNRYR